MTKPDQLEKWRQTIIGVHRDAGINWLGQLDSLIRDCEKRWEITIHQPFPDLSYNYVAPATAKDGMKLVVKLGVPHAEGLCEIEALRYYNGRGMVNLIDSSASEGALLLEDLRPGHVLSSVLTEEKATEIAAEVMRKLWTAEPSSEPFPFPALADWAKGLERLRSHYDGGTGPLPDRSVARAEALYLQLLSSMKETRVLHGDLHHGNILSAEREPWLAIDPKGLIGEAEFEVIAYLRNHLMKHDNPGQVLERRIDQLASHLKLDRERMISWGVCHCVLSAWWSVEDGQDDWHEVMACGELFNGLLK